MASILRRVTPLAATLVMAVPAAFGDAPSEKSAELAWFETRVRPILVDHCYTCHSADTKPAGSSKAADAQGRRAPD
jgi:hypothetical protein